MLLELRNNFFNFIPIQPNLLLFYCRMVQFFRNRTFYKWLGLAGASVGTVSPAKVDKVGLGLGPD